MTQGAFVWYELMVDDPAAAAAFYGAVLGWTAQDSGMAGMAYTLLKMGDRPAAGLMALPQELRARGVPPCWTGYVAVDDVDAAAAAFAGDGGQVRMAPTDIPEVGRFAVVADPQGAVLALFHGQGEMTLPAPDALGFVGWRELMTTDREAALAFYMRLFGWDKLDGVDMGPMGVYQIFGQGGAPIGGMMKIADPSPQPHWRYYFNVQNLRAGAERVKAGGGQVLHGPMAVPGGSWVALCKDPQGAVFALVGPE